MGLCLALPMFMAAQHTPLTSQYLFNGLLINPAYAGSRDALTANMTWRNQWVGFEGAPRTQVISVHSPLKRRKVSLGLLLLNDAIGVTTQTGIYTNYAYRLRFKKAKLQLGFGAGVSMLRGDWTSVRLDESGDATYATDSRGVLRPNFSAGGFYWTKKYFVGVSMPFILAHIYDQSADKWTITARTSQFQPMIFAGMVHAFSKELKLKPTVLLRYQVASGPQVDLNANLVLKERIWAGVSWRSSDAVVFSMEVLPTPQWRIGYAYDLGISKLSPYHGGSHEIMLQYEFGYRIRVRDPRYF